MPPNLTPLESVAQLSPGVYRILGQNPGPFTLQGTNTYLVGTGKRKILIDAGEPNIQSYIIQLKNALGSDGTIECIIATHWHEDHVGGIPQVHELTGSTVPVYKMKRSDGLEESEQYMYVEDGHEVATEGATLKILFTPGHTADHAVVYYKEENTLFSGDCILGEGTSVFEDLHTYMNSLNILLELNPSRIYPGHGPVIESPTEKIREYIAHRQQREEQIVEAIRTANNSTSAMDITNAVYKDIPLAVKLAALSNVKHHLSKLLKDNRIAQISPDQYRVAE
jgi:ribonuclease/clavin/mitogillin